MDLDCSGGIILFENLISRKAKVHNFYCIKIMQRRNKRNVKSSLLGEICPSMIMAKWIIITCRDVLDIGERSHYWSNHQKICVHKSQQKLHVECITDKVSEILFKYQHHLPNLKDISICCNV